MSEVGGVPEKFDELESAMGTRLAKVDTLLIVDLILLLRVEEESNIHVGVFIKQKQNTKKTRDKIIKQV
ncbi:MAG TPA: hypothetical protein VFI70_03190 [Nitrososphaeraceae archaeon]|nr:hypothetical protein [Nitrososphaeraceae archaeon]